MHERVDLLRALQTIQVGPLTRLKSQLRCRCLYTSKNSLSKKQYTLHSTFFPETITHCISGDIDGDGNLLQPTSTQFSISCGCSSNGASSSYPPTPTPIAAPTSDPLVPTAHSPTPNADGKCGPGEPFVVSNSIWPEVEGCYEQNGYVRR